MKRNFTCFILTTVVFSVMILLAGTAEANAQEPLIEDTEYLNQYSGLVPISPDVSSDASLISRINDKRKDKIQEVDYMILDSLWNGFSYFSYRQQPFVYHPETGTLVTIKRGALSRDDEDAGTNTLDNLFYRTSDDWGYSWTDPMLVYNAKADQPRYYARYPSIYPFIFEEDLVYIYTSPLTDGDGWQGFLNGIYYGAPINTFSANYSLDIEGNNYGWGTDAKLLGGVVDEEPYTFAIGGVMPPGGNRGGLYNDNSNMAYRYTEDFGAWDYVIPEAWSASNFLEPTSDSASTARIISLHFAGEDKDIYMGAFCVFNESEYNNRFVPSFCKSTDHGRTWSDLDYFDFSLARTYAQNEGMNPDSVAFFSGSKDMTVLDNGDVYFVLKFYEGNANLSYNELPHHLVEVFNESGVWGMRKISDVAPLWLPLWDEDNTRSFRFDVNQVDYEMQISRTLDGENLLVKWVDLQGFNHDVDEGTVTFTDHDLFIASREVGQSDWNVTNLTNDSLVYHRITWIPDYLPNNLEEIPILELMSIPNENDSDQDRIIRYRSMYAPQYLLCGHFNVVVGVEDNIKKENSRIEGVYPNPASDYTNLHFNINNPGNCKIELYTVQGEIIKVLHNDFVTAGLHNIRIETNNLVSGAYYCVLTVNGERETQILNIVK